MSDIKYIANAAGVEALNRTPEMLEYLKEKAAEGAQAAKGFAPVATGAYRDSIDSDSKIDRGKATGFIFAKDFKAHWIEFGTEDTPTFAPLRKGAESAGLKVKDR